MGKTHTKQDIINYYSINSVKSEDDFIDEEIDQACGYDDVLDHRLSNEQN